MNKIFWSITILEAVAVCVLAVALVFPQRGGGGSVLEYAARLAVGGASIVLAVVALTYWNTQSTGVRQFLLIVVAAPVAIGAISGIVDWVGSADERRIEKYNDYRLMYWKEPVLTRFVLAVYELDTGKVRSLSREVDINGLSTSDYTPLKVAVERAVLAEKEPEGPGRSLEMVRLLLSLGAKPNSGLRAACHNSSRTDAVRLLLEAGADPNNREPGDRRPPAYFACIESPDAAAGLENLRLMREKGADFRLKGDWTPPIAAAASEDKWEIALFLHESGAPWRDERDGGWIDSRAAADLAEAKEKGQEPSEALLRVMALLKKE